MADAVQTVLDEMVPALRDLLSKSIFTETEIRSIVERRRASEYLLRRRTARKADFLRYIEDEVQLERLRSLRNRRILAMKARDEARREQQQRKDRSKGGSKDTRGDDKKSKKGSSIGDASIVKHVHFIYVRALRKWRDDVSLHLSHADFAKRVGSYKRLGRIYAEALQVHPRNTTLWIEAASHEFFGHAPEGEDDETSKSSSAQGGSVGNARVLLQRALRVNPRSLDLWLQYFALEFHYIQKLRGRREILRLGLRKFEGAGGDGRGDGDEDDGATSDRVPRIVYDNAIKSIPDDVRFRLRFVDLCREFPETDQIEAHIMSTVERDFDDVPEAWIARAEYAAEKEGGGEQMGRSVGFLSARPEERDGDSESGSDRDEEGGGASEEEGDGTTNTPPSIDKDALEAAHRVLDDATDRIRTAEMYVSAIRFVREAMLVDHDASSGKENDCSSSNNAKRHAAFLGHLFQKAESARVGSADLVLERADYLLGTGDALVAVETVRAAIANDEGKCAKVARVWLKWAHLSQRVEASGLSRRKDGAHQQADGPWISCANILRRALKRIPIHQEGHVEISASLFKHLVCQKSGKVSRSGGVRRQEEVSRLFQSILLLSRGGAGSNSSARQEGGSGTHFDANIPELCFMYLQHSYLTGGLPAARGVYETVLFKSNYAKSSAGKSPMEVGAMKAFFDACLCLEQASNSNAASAADIATKGGRRISSETPAPSKGEYRVRVQKLYDAAIHFFRQGGETLAANAYKHRRNEDRTIR